MPVIELARPAASDGRCICWGAGLVSPKRWPGLAERPGVTIVGYRTLPHCQSDGSDVTGDSCRRAAAAKPDLILVALGPPKQESVDATVPPQPSVRLCPSRCWSHALETPRGQISESCQVRRTVSAAGMAVPAVPGASSSLAAVSRRRGPRFARRAGDVAVPAGGANQRAFPSLRDEYSNEMARRATILLQASVSGAVTG